MVQTLAPVMPEPSRAPHGQQRHDRGQSALGLGRELVAGIAGNRVCDHGERILRKPLDGGHLARAHRETIGHDRHRGNPQPLGGEGVVQTARRAAASVADAGDDRIRGGELLPPISRITQPRASRYRAMVNGDRRIRSVPILKKGPEHPDSKRWSTVVRVKHLPPTGRHPTHPDQGSGYLLESRHGHSPPHAERLRVCLLYHLPSHSADLALQEGGDPDLSEVSRGERKPKDQLQKVVGLFDGTGEENRDSRPSPTGLKFGAEKAE